MEEVRGIRRSHLLDNAKLKACLDGMLERTHLGLIRYSEQRLYQTGRFNTLQFINTKREQYGPEQEVRAIVGVSRSVRRREPTFDLNNAPRPRPLPENKRHDWVHDFKRRRIDVKALPTGVVVSPFADKDALAKAKQWADVRKHEYEVRRSNLAIG